MGRRLLDHEADSGVTTYHHFDELTDETTIEVVQDAAPFLRINEMNRNDDSYKRQGMKNDMLHVARIPIGVQAKWMAEYGVDIYNKDHWPRVKRLLNDPNYRYLRTTTGQL